MKKTIWIVDDDDSIRWVLEKALAREGLVTRSFRQPDEVMQALWYLQFLHGNPIQWGSGVQRAIGDFQEALNHERATRLRPDEVLRAIQSTNANLPAGNIAYGASERLVRVEGKIKDAREFMPPDLVQLWDHYLKLDTARRNEKSDAAIAASAPAASLAAPSSIRNSSFWRIRRRTMVSSASRPMATASR